MVNTLEYIIKKYSLDISRNYFVPIPNMGRDNLAELFAELGFSLGAEIGVHLGEYSEILLKTNPNLYLYSIDPWKASAYEPGVHGIDSEQEKFDGYYEEAKKKLAPYRCEIMRKESMLAAKYFPDESLDFVYIDGNHEFVNVAEDLHTWKKKVRIGGIISGHDYAFFSFNKHNHVKHVLHSYTRAYKIIPYFVVGAEAIGQPAVIRDKFRSWFWVKA